MMNRFSKNKKNFGFTLIELLFVIAIIGVVFSIGLSLTRGKAEQFKIEKTALQMEQILQGAMAFYVDNGCWPNMKTGKCKDIINFDPYLPVGGNRDPWGNMYVFAAPPDAPNKFRVTDTLGAGAPWGNIVERIAALLPNAAAITTDGKKVVYAEVAIPGVANNNSDTIKLMGIDEFLCNKDTSSKTINFANADCPSGWHSNVLAFTADYTVMVNKHDIENNPSKGAIYVKGATRVDLAADMKSWVVSCSVGEFFNEGDGIPQKKGTARVIIFEVCKKN